MDWTKPSSSGTDWEAVFEHPESGLIPLVSMAGTPEKLRAVTMLLVEQLFLRESDADSRAEYRASLERIFGPGRPLGELMPEVVDFLRAIKQDRIVRAGPPRDHETLEAEERSSADAPSADDEKTTEELFATVFRAYVRARFDVLTDGLDETLLRTRKPPFILSTDFADRFIGCLERHFLPRLAKENRGLLIRAETQAPSARADYLDAQMKDHRARVVFVETWTTVWRELTVPKKLPPRPAKKPASLREKLFGKGAAKKGWEMTLEDWTEAAAVHKKAKRIWAEIVEQSDAYMAPTDDDNRLLMNMLGRTPGGLQKQLAAIAQMVVQNASPQTFEAYQSGRDIDLALLVACYRHPDTMLGGDGFLSRMLRAQPESYRRERFPLVSRYILDAMAEAG